MSLANGYDDIGLAGWNNERAIGIIQSFVEDLEEL